MNRITPLITIAVLAGVPAAAGATTQDLPKPGDPQYAVPAGKVEHSVTVTEVKGSKAVPSKLRHELWLSRNRAHSVVTDMRTGRIRAETVVVGRETRTYSAETNQITITTSKRRSLPFNSSLFEAAVQKAYLDRGITKVTGETAVRGRRALIVENVRGKWTSDRPDGTTIAVIDAETSALYERTTTLPDGEFSQSEKTQTRMLQGGSSHVRFAMKRHKGAKVSRVRRR